MIDLNEFLEQDIRSYLDEISEDSVRSHPAEEDEIGLLLGLNKFQEDAEKALLDDNFEKAESIFQDARKKYLSLPQNSPNRTTLAILLKHIFLKLHEYAEKHNLPFKSESVALYLDSLGLTEVEKKEVIEEEQTVEKNKNVHLQKPDALKKLPPEKVDKEEKRKELSKLSHMVEDLEQLKKDLKKRNLSKAFVEYKDLKRDIENMVYYLDEKKYLISQMEVLYQIFNYMKRSRYVHIEEEKVIPQKPIPKKTVMRNPELPAEEKKIEESLNKSFTGDELIPLPKPEREKKKVIVINKKIDPTPKPPAPSVVMEKQAPPPVAEEKTAKKSYVVTREQQLDEIFSSPKVIGGKKIPVSEVKPLVVEQKPIIPVSSEKVVRVKKDASILPKEEVQPVQKIPERRSTPKVVGILAKPAPVIQPKEEVQPVQKIPERRSTPMVVGILAKPAPVIQPKEEIKEPVQEEAVEEPVKEIIQPKIDPLKTKKYFDAVKAIYEGDKIKATILLRDLLLDYPNNRGILIRLQQAEELQ